MILHQAVAWRSGPTGSLPTRRDAPRRAAPAPVSAALSKSGAVARGVALWLGSASAVLGPATALLGAGPALAGSPGSEMNEPQKVVAEAWRTVDKNFVDRSFNGVDWFSERTKALAAADKVASGEDAYTIVDEMLERLGDKYTRFLPPDKYASLVSSATGEVAGSGLTLDNNPAGDVVIVAVEPDSPAEAAGVRAADVIAAIDGDSARGLDANAAAGRLRGSPGSRVGVVLERKGNEAAEVESVETVLTRKLLKLKGVRASVEPTADGGGSKVGVIKITSFSTNTAESVQAALPSLSGVSAIVLDLRANAGGFLGGGVDTARLFLPNNARITAVAQSKGQPLVYDTVEEGAEISTPLLVLADEKTASASEVLAAALQDNKRARIVTSASLTSSANPGRTFGKGIIQTVESIRGDAGVAVTVAKYITPSGRSINGIGVLADVKTDCEPGAAAAICVAGALKQ